MASKSSHSPEVLRDMVGQFDLKGELTDIAPYGTGHINDTYAGRYKTSKGEIRYIHQRINHTIFKNPEALMENIARVTAHVGKKAKERGGDPVRETLTIVPTKKGGLLYNSPSGDYWRTYVFLEGAKTYDKVDDLRMVYEASYAFGNFQKLLADLPGGRLNETIPDFHHTKKRFATFLDVLKKDPKNRAAQVKADIDFVLIREADAGRIVDKMEKGEMPERITHNDTKFNNVMIDDATKKGICVIDLDTVMPGSPLYDFGDSVRIGTATALEDERDLSKVTMDIGMFERLSEGYLAAAREFLTPVEMSLLAFSGKLLTFECGMRFLTDFLNGDIYFRKIDYETHNLTRCRTQFKMVADMENKLEAMEKVIAKYGKAS